MKAPYTLPWLAALCLGAATHAQTLPTPAGLPPEAAVQTVLSQLPAVRAASAGLPWAQARSQRLQVGPYDWVAKAGANRRRDSEGGRYTEGEVGLETTLRWPAKVGTDQQLGRAAEQLAALALADAWHEAARTLLDDWFDTLREARTAALLQAQDALMERLLAVTRRRVETGEAAPLELLAAQAERARWQAQAARAQAQAELSRASLRRRYAGLSEPPAAAPASTAPDAPPQADAEAGARWVARILEDNHELELAQARAAEARLQAQRTLQERHPDPTVGVRATHERGGQERVIGVYLSLPLGNAGRAADAQAALAKADMAEQESEQVRQKVELAAWRTASQAQQSQATLARQHEALTRTEQSAALQERAYALGESAQADTLLAQRNALEARLTFETAALDARQAQARLLLDAHRLWTPPQHLHAR